MFKGIQAVIHGDTPPADPLEELRRQADRGEDLNAPDKLGVTPIFFACKRGDVDSVKFLIGRGAKVDVVSHRGDTPLFWAAQEGHTEVARILLEQRAPVDAPTKKGATSFLIAAYRGHAGVFDLLVACGANCHQTTAHERNGVYLATEEGRVEIVQRLLALGVAADRPDHEGRTPLMVAIMKGDPEIARMLIGAGAKVDAATHAGVTPLMLTLTRNSYELTAILIEAGVCVNRAFGGGMTPLELARSEGHVKLVTLLLDHGAEESTKEKTILDLVHLNDLASTAALLRFSPRMVNFQSDELGWTPVHVAVINLNPKMLSLLVENGADVNRPNKEGKTALHHAAGRGATGIVQMLIHAGADVTAAYKGQTAIDRAVRGNHAETAQLLRKHLNSKTAAQCARPGAGSDDRSASA